jgi:hypothetical protein
MADFPTALSSVVDNVDDVMAKFINNIEAKIGINGSAVNTSIDYLLKNASSSNPGHKHTLAAGATDVSSSAAELNALDGQTDGWVAWTPTTANITKGSGTITAVYNKIGKTVHFKFRLDMAADSAMGTAPTITLPVTARRTNDIFEGFIIDSGTAYYKTMGFTASDGSVCTIYVQGSANTYVGYVGITATVPMTWAVNDVLVIQGTYEAS